MERSEAHPVPPLLAACPEVPIGGTPDLSRQDGLMQVKSTSAAGQYKLINEILDPLAAWSRHSPSI